MRSSGSSDQSMVIIMNSSSVNHGSSEDALVVDDLYVDIPSDRYEAKYLHYETLSIFKSPKVVLWMEITSFGREFGVTVPKFYNARRLRGKPGKSGKFSVGRRSNLMMDFCSLFPEYGGRRMDRLPMSYFKDQIFNIKVKTVTKNFQQKSIPTALQYSVIESIERGYI